MRNATTLRSTLLTLAAVASAAGCGDDSQPTGDGGTTADTTADTTVDASSTTDTTTASTTGGSDGEEAGDSSGSGDTGDFPAAIPDDCIDDVTAGEHVFACDGLTYDVTVPEACLSSACGLVLDVHGFTMNARMQDNNTNMRALGVEHGYIVVQPNAIPDPPQSSWVPGPDDDKVFDFLNRASAAWHVDAARIHFTGFSQGGYMTWRFVCQHADVLASAAPAAACAMPSCGFADGMTPSEAVDILYIHGTDDALVDFECAYPGRDAVVAAWDFDDPEVVSEDSEHRWTRYTNRAGTVFEFIEHDYAAASPIIRSHCFPGASDPGGEQGQLFPFHCEGDNAFVWGEAAMQFFIAHPKN